MAKGGFDPMAVVPITSNLTIGTAANTVTNIKSSSILAIKVIITAPPAKACFLGNSSVSSTKGIPIAAGTSLTLDSFYPTGQNKPISYDLGRWYLICTAASQVATITIFGKRQPGTTTDKPF